MTRDQIAQIKRVNAKAIATTKPEMSAMTMRIVLGLSAITGAIVGLTFIARAAGL